ncbi:hypothetical protein IC757_15395 [Wenzhouxiangella sp. AB-CW3]|uniref:hypothetical protein n=1 Tax=Wenzhouxiangella sp. AB-CW3 TaxID=2771012 RepID=UPI00168B14C7|nr:hypothetical protein [Wenzhouxiangella sp. AB-CW3]QOC22375.1 hypothetical protein IC757_15395 [Wenzhouxiangella sp. AB-CW3]
MMLLVLERALRAVSARRELLARRLPVPLGLALLAMVLDWLRPLAGDFPGLLTAMLTLAVFSLYLAATVLVAVVVHRVMLLGDAVSRDRRPSWTFRETWFALHLFAVLIVVMLLLVLAAFPVIGWLLALLAIGYVVGRLSLVFPGISVDRAVSFGYSWRLTAGHGFSMFMLVAFIPCVLFIPLAWMPDTWWGVPLRVALGFGIEIFAIACLSLAYHELTTRRWGQNDRTDEEAAG